MSQRVISITEIQNLLKEGVTRNPSDKGYSAERGSIAEKFQLNKAQVSLLFKHPKLAGLRTVIPVDLGFELVDDTETSGFGVPSAAAIERLENDVDSVYTDSPSLEPTAEDHAIYENTQEMNASELPQGQSEF